MIVLTRCDDDAKTLGHRQLIEQADRLAVAVLAHSTQATALAEEYRALRIRANTEALQAVQPRGSR